METGRKSTRSMSMASGGDVESDDTLADNDGSRKPNEVKVEGANGIQGRYLRNYSYQVTE